MRFIFLTEQFYIDYCNCTEIEQKKMRPYTQVYTKINGHIFAIPLRSNIKHKHVLWTNKECGCGLDYSKAVILLKDEYIDNSISPHIRQDEFESLRGKEYIIAQGMIKYIKEYIEAKSMLHIERNQALCRFSTMQYFEEYIKDI